MAQALRSSNVRLHLAIIGFTLLVTMVVAFWQIDSRMKNTSISQQHAEHYWGMYATEWYRTHGNWQTAQSQLEQEVARYELIVEHISILIWAPDQKTLVFTNVRDAPTRPELTRSNSNQPIVSEGQIVGYVQVAAVSSAGVTIRDSLLLMILATSIYVGMRVTVHYSSKSYRKRNQDMLRQLIELADLVDPGGRISPNTTNAQVELDSLSQLTKRIASRVYVLENVRKSMVADIAHELRSPLTIMRAQLEHALLKQQPMPAEKLSLLYDELYRMSKLVDDLQQLVLAEAGMLPLEKKWVSIGDIVTKVTDTLALEAEERGIQLLLEAEETLSAYADPSRITQVLINLIGNAFRYASTTVEVRATIVDSYVEISIRDDGQGIDDEFLPYVFDRFYKGSRKESEHGLGLGLAIVKEFIQAHRGTVTVESRWGAGTTFTISLPIIHE